MNETTLAYLAGAIDSDGSFTVRVDKTLVNRGENKFAQYNEMISLKQVTPEVPKLLRETFGGCLYLQAASVTKGRPLWSWHVSSLKASKAIRSLMPYLIIKRKQAALLLRLRARKDAFNARKGTGVFTGLTLNEVTARETIRTELRQLNKVGL